MTLKHTTGDTVTIREDLTDVDGKVSPGLNFQMRRLAGKIARITSIREVGYREKGEEHYYTIDLDSGAYLWDDWMFERSEVFIGETLYN